MSSPSHRRSIPKYLSSARLNMPPENTPITIGQVLRQQREHNANRIAIAGADCAPLTYAGLGEFVDELHFDLTARGLTYPARVAEVIPNGPEIAAAFISVASTATCAPLNPSYRADEFEFYLSDLRASAVMVDALLDSPVRDVAKKLGIDILDVQRETQTPAGCFTLRSNQSRGGTTPCLSTPNDVALLLHTSGTTSRPKLVPLTHANLCAS